MLAVDREPLGLPVRRVRPAHVGPLVVTEPEPPQILEHAGDGFLGDAARVGILHSQHERAAVVTREQPGEQGAPHVADVERPARGRREPTANTHRTVFPSVPTPSTSTSTTSPCREPPDALGSAREHHVARQEGHERRDVLDQGGDPVDHVDRAGVLAHVAVQSRLDDDIVRIEVRLDPRPERARPVEALGPRPLVVGLLQVSQCHVVRAGVAQDHPVGRPRRGCPSRGVRSRPRARPRSRPAGSPAATGSGRSARSPRSRASGTPAAPRAPSCRTRPRGPRSSSPRRRALEGNTGREQMHLVERQLLPRRQGILEERAGEHAHDVVVGVGHTRRDAFAVPETQESHEGVRLSRRRQPGDAR